jgi:CheY-like chemotaxis protein
LDALQVKRIALAGFDPETARRLTSVFETASAFCRPVTTEDAAPGSALLNNFDLLLLTPDVATPWLKVRGRVSDVPLLILGESADIIPHLAAISGPGRDFILHDAPDEALLIRAAILLVQSGGRQLGAARSRPLVVAADDDLSVTSLVRALLTSDGFACETAGNGGEALQLARKLRPDVLICDVNMPQMSGFEVLSAIKQDPATVSIRVILLTGAEQESDIMRGFTLGAADYVVKPFNPLELLVRTRRFVRTS